MAAALRPPYPYRLERVDPGGLPGERLEARKRVAGFAIAGGLVGVHKDPAAEAAVMLPHDAPAWALGYLPSASTCALAALAYLRLLGAEHELLELPYAKQIGHAVANVVTIAIDARVWRLPAPAAPALPAPGDVVLIGHAEADGKPDPAFVRGTRATEHVVIVASVAGDVLSSVDGGQPGVEWRTRRLARAGGGRELWLSSSTSGLGPDGRPLVGRRVVGWLDLGALPLPREAYVPLGVRFDE